MLRKSNFVNVILAKAILALLLIVVAPAFGQNLITNGNFENNNQLLGYETDYSYYGPPPYLTEAGVYVVKRNPNMFHNQWFEMGDHTSGSGRFFIANGKGLLSNYRVWATTVNVTQNTNYSFTFWASHISNGNGTTSWARFRVTINGTQVGTDNWQPQFVSGGYWDQFPAATWNSGTATTATIIIYDRCPLDSGFGDDFGIDDISFTPDVSYSVVANNDNNILACQDGQPVPIDVLSNDVIMPNANEAVVSVVTNPSHGTYTVSNNIIYYTFTGGNYTTDQIKYRVTTHGVYSEAWVFITTSQAPTIGNISAPSVICTGGSLGIGAPSVTPSGTGIWQKCQTSTGTNWTTFDPTSIPLSMNGWWVRYSATNDCGTGASNAVQITVTDGPSFSAQTPQVQPICAGGSLTLTPPAYSANGSQILSQGWVASPTETGNYSSFNLNNITAAQNGWYIRYMVEGNCGMVYSSPARQLVVNAAPDVTGSIQAPNAICAGGDLDVAIPDFVGDGTGTWEICQTQNGNYQTFNVQGVPTTYNNWYLHYKLTNDCDSDVSNAVQIHVNDAPVISNVSAPAAICAGGSFALTTPNIQNNGATITNQGWQIQINGNWQSLNNNNIPYEYNGCQIRYFAENECGMVYSATAQAAVNDEPLVGNVTAPAGICAGSSFNLTAPQVTWRHINQGTGSWEIQINGTWQPLNNNNIPYSYNGCNIRYKAVNGCGTAYSSNTAQVTVYSTDPINEGEITACDDIYYHGQLCDHNGNYTIDSVTPNGCTIQVSWHFTLGEAYIAPVQYQESCESYYWPKTQQTYYESDVYDTLVVSQDPQVCDSTYTLVLTVNHAPEILTDLIAPSTVCVGYPLGVSAPQVQMNHSGGGSQGWEYATSANGPFTAFDPLTTHLNSGNYFLRYVVTNGCGEVSSNVVSFRVDDAPTANVQLSAMQVCEGETLDLPEVNVTWNNEDVNDRLAQWQMSTTENGNFTAISPTMPMQMSYDGNWLRYIAHNSCGDYIAGPVLIRVVAEAEDWLETIEECDYYVLETGEVIHESQVLDFETYDPCRHIIHQPVVINHSDQVTDVITSCHDSYEWNGMTFYHSDTPQYSVVTLTNVTGCDSIVELQLNFDSYAAFTYDRTACDSYVWDMNPNHVYTESVRDSVFVAATNEEDCDTWYYLNLTVGHDTQVDGGTMTECSGFVWHGVPYYNDAIVYDSLQTSVTHCDSVVAYQLHIIAPVATDTNIVACRPIWWQEHYCETEGDYQHTFQSVYGCDSLVTLHFSLSEQLVYEFDSLSCEPFQWYEYQCNTDGMTCSHLFQTSQGCDSTVVMHVMLREAVTTTLELQACDYYELNGVVYDEPGVFFIELENLETQAGCDSIVQIRLEIKDSEAMGVISGDTSVFVASNLVSGVYRYEIDTTGIVGNVAWSLSNPDWQVIESANDHCLIHVSTPGTTTLTATFTALDCGEMEREIVINAGYFGVEEQETHDVQVYPNPTKGTLHIEAEDIQNVRLVNMMGQVLESLECPRGNHIEMNLVGYAPSVYLLEIKTDKGMVKKRVVLCR